MDSEDSRDVEPTSPPDRQSSDSDRSPVRPAEGSRDGWSGRESPSPSPESRSNSLPREAVRPARRRMPPPKEYSEPSPPPKDENPPTEEISDGEMESDQEPEKPVGDDAPRSPLNDENTAESNARMNHEDLSDVSDLESTGLNSEDEQKRSRKSPGRTDKTDDKPDVKINGDASNTSLNANENSNADPPKAEKSLVEKISKMEDAEEQLDFEAEEGECIETPAPSKKGSAANEDQKNSTDKNGDKDPGSEVASEVEEGEITDTDDKRPEETEPRPVCRFYSRGQCTWGISCRFLHPGVTDKGNYTMFDMVRSMPAGGYNHHSSYSSSYGSHPGLLPPPAAHHAMYPPIGLDVPTESAWERGLRTAKEMMLKANKRREQEPDFEEKKMYLTGGAGGRTGSIGPLDDDDLDLAAYAGYPTPLSPPPVKKEYDDYYRPVERRAVYEDVAYSSSRSKIRYRQSVEEHSPTHRSAYYYEEKLDDRLRGTKSKRAKTTREVIVQKVSDSKKGDDWADPWMRSGGATTRRSRERRDKLLKTSRPKKYSSASSYTSSSSSRSSSRTSSSKRSDSRGRRAHRRRSTSKQRASPSMIVQERKAANARAQAMNPPAPTRKRPPSPAATRQYASNPPAPSSKGVDAFGRAKELKKQANRKRCSSSSESDSSSSSSGSESGSRSSSSSRSSTDKRPARVPTSYKSQAAERKPVSSKPPAAKPPSPKVISQKKDVVEDSRKDGGKKRAAASPPSAAIAAKKPVSRREELLKQLKAVEDAIARKRSKI